MPLRLPTPHRSKPHILNRPESPLLPNDRRATHAAPILHSKATLSPVATLNPTTAPLVPGDNTRHSHTPRRAYPTQSLSPSTSSHVPYAFHWPVVTVPEPIPSASSLPEDPPPRSEHIDLTRAIKRCRTWQQLRHLYWTNRTRHGAINVVSYFTQLAALLPDLPAMLAAAELAETGTEPAEVVADAEGPEGPAAGTKVTAAAAAAKDAGGSPGYSGRRDRHVTGSMGFGRGRRMAGGGAGGSGGDAVMAAAVAAKLDSSVQRAALRQLLVRMVYDACSFTREHVAAGRLDEALSGGARGGIEPWDTRAFVTYVAEEEATGSSDGWDRDGGNASSDGGGEPAFTSPPLTFWDWLRDRPAVWTHDPLAEYVGEGLQHWAPSNDVTLNGATAAVIGIQDAGGGAGAGLYGSATTGGGDGTTAASDNTIPQRKIVPVCFGPQELATLAWAAARLQLHVVLPDHVAWLTHDLLYGSFVQMSYFDGRQLAQLAYGLAALGPAGEAPGRWRRRFLSAASVRLDEMDGQSLANLAHSLEPLHLAPSPDWLRQLMAASGTRLQRQELSAAEMTQLAWAVYGARKRLYRPRRWAAEVLSLAADIAHELSGAAVTSAPVASGAAWEGQAIPQPPQSPAARSLSEAQAQLRSLLEEAGAPVSQMQPHPLHSQPQPPSNPSGLSLRSDAEHQTGASSSSLQQDLLRHGSTAPSPPISANDDAGDVNERVGSGHGVNRGSAAANPWVSEEPAGALLSWIETSGRPHAALAQWLMQQPTTTLRLLRVWVRASRTAESSNGVVAAPSSTDPWVSGAEQSPSSAAANSLAASFCCLNLTHSPHSPPTPSIRPHGTGQEDMLIAAPGVGITSSSTSHSQSSSTSSNTPPAARSLLRSLHTDCWPSQLWLEALATASTTQLNAPGFRAQNIGILLWSLAGLGYRPHPGWLGPWLERAATLQRDFRPANLASVLCVLSAWGELPTGRPAATLAAAAARTVPYMAARELQLTAAAMARLCELPSSSAPPPLTSTGMMSSSPRAGRGVGTAAAATAVGSRVGRDGRREDGAGRVGRHGANLDGGVGEKGPKLFITLQEGGMCQMVQQYKRYRAISPALARQLVNRAVEVSYAYRPRHMAAVLRLLVLRLECPMRLATLTALLNGHAVHLESMAAASDGVRQRGSASGQRQQQFRWVGDNEMGMMPYADSEGDNTRAGGGGSGAATQWGPRRRGLQQRQRELRELAAAALEAVRHVAGAELAGAGDEAAAALLPVRWWKAYIAALRSFATHLSL